MKFILPLTILVPEPQA